MGRGSSKAGGGGGGFKLIENAKSFDSTAEANEFFGDNLANLTDKEKNALTWYTGSGYDDLNAALRKGTENPHPNRTKSMDDGIAKAELKEPITVYRGSSGELLGLGESPTIDQIKPLVGRSFHDNAFVSTSAKKGGGFTYQDVMYEIVVPPGKGRGQYIENISKFKGGSEVEYLLKRGTHFRITGVSGTNAQPVVHMQIIDG